MGSFGSAGKLYRLRCYVTPSVHTLLSVSCLEQHSKRRPQHLYLPCGRFPTGRGAASASDSSLEGLAAASKSQSILLLPGGTSAVVWSHTCAASPR